MIEGSGTNQQSENKASEGSSKEENIGENIQKENKTGEGNKEESVRKENVEDTNIVEKIKKDINK
jgi:hypothetical protein